MHATVLRLDGVGRRYGLRGPWVLRDVALELLAGALVRVEGVNGSGKSTLLRLLAGVDRPTAGRVTGRPAASTAYVPERFPAALPFPALRYLTHLGAVRGLPAATARARAAYWLESFGVAGYARTPLDELSKGTCQKVAIAQALLADPGLLVLDEAWTGLDTAARATLDAAVRARTAAGGTVVFVDHDPRRLAGEQDVTVTVDAAAGRVGTRPRTPAGAAPPPGRVLIEAEGTGELPAGVRPYALPGAPPARLVLPAAASDAALRTLLTADPPWHITTVRPASRTEPAPEPAPEPVPVPVPDAAVAGPAEPSLPAPDAAAAAAPPAPLPAGQPGGGWRRGGALVRYQAALLARSHRWLAPLLGYGAVMAVGVGGGEPVLGSMGYAAALLLPVTAWLVRVCVRNEPAAARACTASAVGPGRAHAGALAVGVGAAALLGAAGTALVAAVSGAHSDDLGTAVAVGPAALAGLLAAVVAVLLGGAVGALTNPPLVRGTGWSLLVTALGAGAVLLVSGSPAQAAVTGLVTGSRTGAVHYPLLPLALAAAAAAAAGLLSCAAVSRLGAE
ncbi:ABC transporter ATP-binding protein [Streptomyces sp. NRRL F-5123]|uniref:ABC transporter ATP-binding protein n=1 Tax=Streptomyces sp. NRRL F-5123 TaxID=1463856 RepID=UPI0007C44AC0|nr:ATP-binding cassette domain-containing protein [Streptomyces sp. NRRL F-5123]